MKQLFILITLLIVSNRIWSQDLIVTNEGDSINCKITNKTNEYLYFTFKHKDEVRSTLTLINNTKSYKYNYFKQAEVPVTKIVYGEQYPHWRVAFNTGWSYRTAPVSDGFSSSAKQYIEGLKSGYHFSAEAAYYFTESLGLGGKLLYSNASNSANNISTSIPGGGSFSGNTSDDISVTFAGPYFAMRMFDAKKANAFILNFGIGYLGYTDRTVVGSNNLKVTGSTAGFLMDLGYDILISKNCSIGFQLALLGGTLTSVDVSDGYQTKNITLTKEQYESLGRIDLSVGIRFSSSN